jgi:DNA-binding LacI/PurR family transcriptional regulator
VFEHAGYDLLIGTAHPMARSRLFRGDAPFLQRVDGAILVDVFCAEEGARQLANMGHPVVVLGERLEAVVSVSVDNRRGGRMAARHLLDLGHRRIALVGGHDQRDCAHSVPTERAEGFSAALAAAGLKLSSQYCDEGGFTVRGGYEAMHRLLGLSRPPTAVFFMSDEMAFGGIQALRDRHLVAGQDVAIVGFDDHPVSGAFGLTTVRQPVRDIGRLGARLLLDQLDGFGQLMHHPVELDLIERESTVSRQAAALDRQAARG